MRTYSKLYSELKGVLGDDALTRFLRAFGGSHLWIPVQDPGKIHLIKNGSRNQIENVLTPAEVDRLYAAFGGDYLMVPLGTFRGRREQIRKVAELHKQHTPINEIAAIMQVSRRTVFRWLNTPITELRP